MKNLSNLSNSQFKQLIELYAERTVDKMSLNEMKNILYDIYVDTMEIQSKEAVIDTIKMEFSSFEIEEMLDVITE